MVLPQPTEWQHIGNEINTAMIFARADLVCVFNLSHFLAYVVIDSPAPRRARTGKAFAG
jgi:hypothetical protein